MAPKPETTSLLAPDAGLVAAAALRTINRSNACNTSWEIELTPRRRPKKHQRRQTRHRMRHWIGCEGRIRTLY